MTKETTTREFAKSNLVEMQTVLKRLCQTGSYFGVVPRKLPNGRLAWPLNDESTSDDQEAA